MHRLQFSLLALAPLLLLAGCPDDGDDPEATDDTGGADTGTPGPGSDDAAMDETGPGPAADSGSGGPDLDALYACEEPELAIAQALVGPGFDPETGELVEPVADEYVISTTQILPRTEPDAQQEFFELTNGVIAQLMQTPGFLGFSLALEPTCGFARTITVWESEEAMYAFVGSGAHAQAMGKTFDVGVTGRVTAWTATPDEMPPTWDAAIAKIAEVEPFADGY